MQHVGAERSGYTGPELRLRDKSSQLHQHHRAGVEPMLGTYYMIVQLEVLSRTAQGYGANRRSRDVLQAYGRNIAQQSRALSEDPKVYLKKLD